MPASWSASRRRATCCRAAHGAILFTGASASVKGYPLSAPFAMGKFALRGLAQSMARELSPQGIHVAHFVIDGGIRNPGRTEPPDKPDSMLDPDAIAASYWHVAQPAAQRLDLGGGTAAVGRAVLRRALDRRTIALVWICGFVLMAAVYAIGPQHFLATCEAFLAAAARFLGRPVPPR